MGLVGQRRGVRAGAGHLDREAVVMADDTSLDQKFLVVPTALYHCASDSCMWSPTSAGHLFWLEECDHLERGFYCSGYHGCHCPHGHDQQSLADYLAQTKDMT